MIFVSPRLEVADEITNHKKNLKLFYTVVQVKY